MRGRDLAVVDGIIELRTQFLLVSTCRVRKVQHSLSLWAFTNIERVHDRWEKDYPSSRPLVGNPRKQQCCCRASRAFQEIAGLVSQREPQEKKARRAKTPDVEVDLDQLMSQGPGLASVASGWLPPPPESARPRALFNASTLAYLGDGVYQLYAQRHFLLPPKSVNDLNEKVLGLVRCETQAAMLRELRSSDFLTQEERRIVQWGKNAAQDSSRKAIRRAGGIAYGQATALETLIGYLYLTDAVRLDALMSHVGFGFNSVPIGRSEAGDETNGTTLVVSDSIGQDSEKEVQYLGVPELALNRPETDGCHGLLADGISQARGQY